MGAASTLPAAVFIHGGSHTLCTHARAGTSSPRAHTNACARGHSSLPAHGRAPVAAGHRCLPAFEHPSRSVWAQAVPCQTRRACRRQICPCQARTVRRRISVCVSCGWTRSLAYPSGVPCTEMITGWLHVFLSKHGAGDARIEVSLSCCGHVQAPRTLRIEGARSRGHAFAKSLGGVGKACLWAVVRASLPSQMFFPASSDVAVLPQRPPCVGCLGPKASFMGVESALGDHRQGLDGSQSLYRF